MIIIPYVKICKGWQLIVNQLGLKSVIFVFISIN